MPYWWNPVGLRNVEHFDVGPDQDTEYIYRFRGG